MKVLKNLENAKFLSKDESCTEIDLPTNDIDDETLNLEISGLKEADLDYETIHAEILENIIFDENDSGLSDFTCNEDDEENKQDKIFDIVKIKNIIHKSVEILFKEEQEKDEFNPLFEQEKEIKKKMEEKNNKSESININIYTNTNTELKTQTQDNTIKTSEDFNELKNNNVKYDKEDSNFNFMDDISTKNDEIVNYKKYNFYTDPNSNYNNFTKKYEIKTVPKKRFRDIHPFLKTFNPKFLKKENIDKKIFRRFRKFVKANYKKNKNNPIFVKNPLFWEKFYFKNLLPPVKIMLNNNGHLIEHKSFNTQYLLWLFNQEGTTELFNIFIEKESKNVINNFIDEYNLSKSEEPKIVDKLKEYIKFIPEIYGSYNGEKKVILEENKDNYETTVYMNEREEDLESIESGISSSNPFNLNFDDIEKKNFKEMPYDDADMNSDNNFYNSKFNEFWSKNGENQFGKFHYENNDDCYYIEDSKRHFFK